MTDPADGTLDDRLARLAARRSVTTATQPEPPARRKRMHAAATSRLVAGWLTSSAFLGIVAALGLQSQPATAKATTVVSAAAPPRARTATTGLPGTTPPKVVIKIRHHTVYVDQTGKTIATTAPHATATVPSGATLVITVPANTAATAPLITAAPPAGTVSSPPPSAPVGAPHPTTHVTSPPATSPATAPPTTVFKPPPPPAPPPCSGSKCP